MKGVLFCFDQNCKIEEKRISSENTQDHVNHKIIEIGNLKNILQKELIQRKRDRNILYRTASDTLQHLIAAINILRDKVNKLKGEVSLNDEIQALLQHLNQSENSMEQTNYKLLSNFSANNIEVINNEYSLKNRRIINNDQQLLSFVCNLVVQSSVFLLIETTNKEVEIFLSKEIEGEISNVKRIMKNIIKILIEEKQYQMLSPTSQSEQQLKWSQDVQMIKAHTQPISAVVFNHKQKLIASGSFDSTISIWKYQNSFEKQVILNGHLEKVTCLDFSENANLLASSGYDKHICIWDTEDFIKRPRILIGHTSCVNRIKFQPDSQILISVGNDEKIIVWSTVDFSQITTISQHIGGINSIAFSVSQPYFGTSGQDMQVLIWNYRNFQLIKQLSLQHECLCLEFNDESYNKKVLVCGQLFIEQWDYINNIKLQRFLNLSNSIWSVAFTPLRKLIIISTELFIQILDPNLNSINQQFPNEACSFNQTSTINNSYNLIYGDKAGNLNIKFLIKC